MTDVRTFRAATMREALDLVREKLGADAVILHTRQVARRRILPWRKPVEEVEITASPTLPAVDRKPSQRGARTAQRDNSPRAAEPAVLRGPASPASGRRANHLDLVSAPPETLPELERGVRARRDVRLPARPPTGEAGSRIAGNRFAARSSSFGGAEAVDPTAALARRLDTIQQMLQDLGRGSLLAPREEIPGELFQLYTELIDADVEDELARELVIQLKQTAVARQLSDPAAARALLTAMVESEIRCREPIAPRSGRRKVVALVGATGVGKTTTIAKLAANFRLRSGVKMGLITVDTFRVAAVDQLRTYAEIIDLPMKVVTSPQEMRRALDELAGLDLILIDTAGRSPNDDEQIRDLKALLTEARVDEVHLVLSMTSSLRTLESSAAKFAAAGTTALILTKLDEMSGKGALLSVARRIKLPVSYLTAGQAVPDDIESAHPRRIARIVLGQERVGA